MPHSVTNTSDQSDTAAVGTQSASANGYAPVPWVRCGIVPSTLWPQLQARLACSMERLIAQNGEIDSTGDTPVWTEPGTTCNLLIQDSLCSDIYVKTLYTPHAIKIPIEPGKSIARVYIQPTSVQTFCPAMNDAETGCTTVLLSSDYNTLSQVAQAPQAISLQPRTKEEATLSGPAMTVLLTDVCIGSVVQRTPRRLATFDLHANLFVRASKQDHPVLYSTLRSHLPCNDSAYCKDRTEDAAED